MKQILIVKMSSLGDLIHTFPILPYLKQNHPQCKIDWVVERPFAELIQAHPLVSNVLCVQTKKWRSQPINKAHWEEIISFRKDLRKKKYDLVLDLQGNFKSGLVTATARSSFKIGFGYATVPEWPNILTTHKRVNPPLGGNIRDDYLFIAQSALGSFNSSQNLGVKLKLTLEETNQFLHILKNIQTFDGLKVIVCPGSNWPNKQLSQETLRAFLQCFNKKLKAHFLFLWGDKNEKKMAEELLSVFPHQSSVLDKVSLPILQNLMASVDLVVAMDSLPLHLAGTTTTPTYSLFGPSSAHKYKPIGNHHEAFQGSCPYGQVFNKRCDLLRTCKTGACIKSLEGQQLFTHFFEWWSSEGVTL